MNFIIYISLVFSVFGFFENQGHVEAADDPVTTRVGKRGRSASIERETAPQRVPPAPHFSDRAIMVAGSPDERRDEGPTSDSLGGFTLALPGVGSDLWSSREAAVFATDTMRLSGTSSARRASAGFIEEARRRSSGAASASNRPLRRESYGGGEVAGEAGAVNLEAELPTSLRGQSFGVATFDTTAKHLFTDEGVRLDFVRRFAQVADVTSTTLLDTSLNPLKGLSEVRSLVHSKDSAGFMSMVDRHPHIRVEISDDGKDWVPADHGGCFLKSLSRVFGDLSTAFPAAERNSQLDVVCRLEGGGFVLVEVQVIPQNEWDDRALAYMAAFFGNQLKRGGQWRDLQKVIAVNLLGGGPRGETHWRGAVPELMRHYKFVSEVGERRHEIDSLQLIQYNVMCPNDRVGDDIAMKEWMEFWQRAHTKTAEDVAALQTAAVREAYRRIELKYWPDHVKRAYVDESRGYERYSRHIEAQRAEALTEGELREKRRIALNLIVNGIESGIIATATGLTLAEIENMRSPT